MASIASFQSSLKPETFLILEMSKKEIDIFVNHFIVHFSFENFGDIIYSIIHLINSDRYLVIVYDIENYEEDELLLRLSYDPDTFFDVETFSNDFERR